jgi:Putative auto-transporter adhesin, head GIN domain
MLLLTGCGLVQLGPNTTTITPSNVTTTESRSVSGFTGIDFSTFGTVNISQGSSESLTIEGRDNLVPLVTTSVINGTLFIAMKPNINVTSLNTENLLAFSITIKDLSSVSISGLGNVMMDKLSASDFKVSMSGAGQFKLNQLASTTAGIDISGLGNVEIAGTVSSATVNTSGAGNANCPDLKLQTASVNIPGLGNATLWVTDQLSGTISGAGNVSYYGSPQMNTNVSGLGKFKPLGNK